MLKTPNLTAPTLHQPLHSKVSNYLNAQRRQGLFCDLVMELENSDSKIFGHFCVIAAQSNFIGGSHFLQKSLQFSMQNPLKVTIKNFSCAQCLQTIVDFFYEDVVSIAKEHESHFRKLAKMLVVAELINLFDIHENKDADVLKEEHEEVPQVCTDVGQCVEKPHDDAIDKHVENIFEQRNFFKLKNPRAVGSSSKINYCIGCDFKCYHVQKMIKHMTSCEASHLTCSLCEVGFLGWRDYDAHLKKHTLDAKKPFFCLECDVRFGTRAALLVHYPKHSAETPHMCPECNKGFKWKHGLRSHLLIHNKEKQMLCDVCGYSTTHMKALKSHKLQHTGEFFKCTYPDCNHRANRKENLKLHMETHKQERPFVCEVCGCKFSQSKNLKRHALKHSTGEINKYKCQLCSFSSHRSDKLKEHIQRVHTEKAVQLELPEIVENAFENNVEDEFDLPSMDDVAKLNADTSAGSGTAAGKKRARKKPDVVVKRPPRKLAPRVVHFNLKDNSVTYD